MDYFAPKTVGEWIDIIVYKLLDFIYNCLAAVGRQIPRGKIGRWFFFKVVTPLYDLVGHYSWILQARHQYTMNKRLCGIELGDLHIQIPMDFVRIELNAKSHRDAFIFTVNGENIILSTPWESSTWRSLKRIYDHIEDN